MTANRRIALNVVATYGRSVYAMLCGLFTSRWVLMALGEVDYGLVGVVGGLTGFISFLNGLMAESLVRFYAYAVGAARVEKDSQKGLEECRKWYSIAVAIHSVLPALLVIAGYPCGIWAVKNWLVIPPDRIEACVWVWRCVCLSCFVSMVTVPFSAMYTAKQEIAELTVYSVVGGTVYVVLAYVMTLSNRDWLVYYAAVTCAVAVVPAAIIAFRAVAKYPECRFRMSYLADAQNFRELFRYAGLRFFGAFSQLLTAQGMALAVNKLLGPARNAAMSIGMNLSSKAQMLTLSFRGALQPAITNATGEGDNARANSLSFRTCLVSALGVLAFAIPLVIEVDEVMILWLKNPPRGSGLLCQVMLVALVVDNLTVGLVMRIFATGRIAMFQIVEAFVWISALLIACGWMFCGGDVVGVAIGFLVMYSIDNVLKLFCAKQTAGMSVQYWLRRVALPVLIVATVTLVIGYIPALLMSQSVLRLLVTTAVCELVFVPLVWNFAIGDVERKMILARLPFRFKRHDI